MNFPKAEILGFLLLVVSLPTTASSNPQFSADDTDIIHSLAQKNPTEKNITFPEPLGLKNNINFWLDIYTRYSSSMAVVHDMNNLAIQYEVIDFDIVLGPKASRKAKKRFFKRRIHYYRDILRKLSMQKGVCRTTEECRIVRLFMNDASSKRFKKASRSLRVQFGLSDRFKKGLETSGLYMSRMREIFKSHNLPEGLLALPNVESSFQIRAYSQAGAAGIWQFTRPTGKRYMKINYSVDERRDPIKSTEAAAKLLKRNYEKLGSWPLAITAYNHGRRGMERAKKKYGSDIVAIMKNYKSRSFGFASRNFYAEFIAAKVVAENPEKYFGKISYLYPLQYDEVVLKHYMKNNILYSHFGYEARSIKFLNPDLRPSIWNGTRRIPKGHTLKVPWGTSSNFYALYAKAPKNSLHAKQIIPDYYTVRRGDTLSVIARRFRTSTASLKNYNDLRSRHRIYSGQKLRIPPRNYKNDLRIATAPPQVRKVANAVYTKTAALAKKSMIRTSIPEEPKIEQRIETLSSETVQPPKVSDFNFVEADDFHGLIQVHPEETVGHFSNWSGASIRTIRKLNGGRNLRRIRHGQFIKIPLATERNRKFIDYRYEYHLGIFEDFFNAYRVEKVQSYTISRGDSLWSLTHETTDAPLWLVRLYNKGIILENLQPGQRIRVPLVEKKEASN